MSRLREIFEHKRGEVEAARAAIPLEEIKVRAREAEPPRGFRRALEDATPELALIAEVKRSSPSQGTIREALDPVDIAHQYEAAGAHALSVLTDEKYFGGSSENLIRARKATALPCLRKDFLYDPYQVYEARAWGADAVLLIVAGLEREPLAELYALATALGMDVLVEAHTMAEAEAALGLGAEMIGVNNRDLATFRTDLTVSEAVLPILAGRALGVSESALETRADLERVRAAGARAVLIGTAFMAAPDVGTKVREVMGWPSA